MGSVTQPKCEKSYLAMARYWPELGSNPSIQGYKHRAPPVDVEPSLNAWKAVMEFLMCMLTLVVGTLRVSCTLRSF